MSTNDVLPVICLVSKGLNELLKLQNILND